VPKAVNAVTPKKKVEAFVVPLGAGGSPHLNSPPSDSSVNSFLERTENTIKEGESVVREGRLLLGGNDDEEMGGENAHKKRTHDADQSSGADGIGYKMPFASANNPVHVLPSIPVSVRAKLHDIQGAAEKEHALYDYLNAQTNRLPAELQILVVRQPTLKHKFELLLELLNSHGMQLGA